MAEPLSLTTLPDPTSLTLLFKFARHTVLLSVSPTQPFSTTKSLLLLALESREISHIGSAPRPEDGEDLELAILVDRKDVSKGWIALEVAERRRAEAAAKGVGKKKGVQQTRVGGQGGEGTPEGLGLVDGAWIAVRVREDGKGGKRDGEDEDEFLEVDEREWDVVVPSFEDEEPVPPLDIRQSVED